MKNPLAWCVAWALFWAGDLLSRIMLYADWTCYLGAYEVYNWLMLKSCDLSDKYDLGIWKE